MKNLLFILSMLIFIVACDKDDENGNDILPIKGLELPSSTSPIKSGATVTIKGEGFTKASEIWFRTDVTKAATEKDVKAVILEVTTIGISFTAPAVYGNQDVLLKENGREYFLGKMVFEAQPEGGEDIAILPKKIVKIIGRASSGNSYSDTLLYTYNAEGKITSETERDYDRIRTNEHQYENNKILVTGTFRTRSFELKDGKTHTLKSWEHTSANANRLACALTYNPAGYMETAKSRWSAGDKFTYSRTHKFTFTNGCITQYTNTNDRDQYQVVYTYEYGDSKQMNNANIDLWGAISFAIDPYVGEVFTLGVGGKRSKYLPIKVKEVNSNGPREESWEYVVNEAGYITKITRDFSWIYEIYYEK